MISCGIMVLEIGQNKLPDKSEFFTKGECMVYFNNEEIIIRDMIFSDGLHFTDEERKQGWDSTIDKFEMRLKDVKNGIGSILMDTAEKIASEYADTVYLGVGLHNGYGSAQRMYVKRGYIPDGSGVWYKDKICTPYDTIYTNDDDLVLYLSKKVR